jgi:hypothetical protein
MKPAPFKSRQLPEQRPSEERHRREEPRTGVVRKVSAQSSQPRSASPQSVPPRSSRSSGVRLAQRTADGWRCLEPAQPEEARPRRDSSVSIAQVSLNGQRLRHSGPDEWLPEAAEFVHRAALLVAQGLGFERCRSVCLQGPESVLSVSEAGPSTINGVTGPSRQLSNVLRNRGLK